MNETAYWIWLLRTLGPAAPIADFLAYFGSPEKLYAAGSTEWRLSGLLTAKQIAALSTYSPSESGEILKACRENGWQIITPQHVCYPKSLLQLRNYPPVLFVWGNPEVLLEPVKISLVGTRKASRYGQRVAWLLSSALSACGVSIVSGGALGVDSAAHMGALHVKGKTIAVLGCGLGTDYLKENAPMRTAIAQNGGAVVSEFLPFSPASRTTFPLRNRIISALSLGTVVVEAGERSGSLITARLALEQGKDVFAVPGDLISTAYTGANKLIKEGAKPVFSPMDVLEEYLYLPNAQLQTEPAQKSFGELLKAYQATEKSTAELPKQTPKKPKTPKQPVEKPKESFSKQTAFLPKGISPTAEKIYAALQEPTHIDVLCETLSMPVAKVLSALTELELLGHVQLQEGKTYQRI